ncbi:MAG: hypothetical protein WA979_05365 [Pacificimonas sp.]
MDISTYFGLTATPFAGPASSARLLESRAFQKARANIIAAMDGGARLITLIGDEGMGKNLLLNGLEAQLSRKALTVCRVMTPAMAGARQVASADVLILDEAGQPETEALTAIERLSARTLKPVVIIGSPRPLFPASADRVEVPLPRLDDADAHGFVLQALQAVGGGMGLFADEALHQLITEGKGLPRRLRVLTTNALFNAAYEGRPTVEATHVAEAAADLPHFVEAPAEPSEPRISTDIAPATMMSLPAVDLGRTSVVTIPERHPDFTPAAPDICAPVTPPASDPQPLAEDVDIADDGEEMRGFPWSRAMVATGLASGAALAAAFFLIPLETWRGSGPEGPQAGDDRQTGATLGTPVPVQEDRAANVRKIRPISETMERVAVAGKTTPSPEVEEAGVVAVEQATEAEPPVPAIMIRYAGDRPGGAALALDVAALMRAQGYVVRDVVPAPFGVGRGSTRYFAPETREAGAKVNRAVSGLLMKRGHDRAAVMDMTAARQADQAGLIEIWVPNA